MTEPIGTPAKTPPTGKKQSAYEAASARLTEPAQRTLLPSRWATSHERRLTPEDIYARLMFIIAITLAACLVIMVMGICWAVIFVTQPMKQAPNDREFISILQTLMIFLTGSLGGVLAGNGLKNRKKEDEKK